MANEVRIKVIVDDDSAPGVAKAIAEQKALQRESKNTSTGIKSAFTDTKTSMMGLALSLSPALLPVLGGITAGIGLVTASFGAAGVGAIGFGVTAKAVLSTASSDATKYSTLMTQLANDTTNKQRQATNQQMAILEQGWSKSYKTVVLDMVGIDAKWKTTSRDIAAPVLVPWLSAVNKGISFMKPLLGPVAADFKTWGQAVNQYLSSDRGSKEVGALATAFGKFAGSQLKDVGKFVIDVGKGIFHLGQDAGSAVPWIEKVGPKLDQWGTSFNKWSQSKEARNDVHSFLKYLHDNGSQLMSFVTQLAKLMPQMFQGASSIGTAELQAMTAFLAFVNKLPKSWQQPIVELAGAMLILKKTGVLSVGIKLSKTGIGGKLAGALSGASDLILPVTLTVAAFTGLSQIKDKNGQGGLTSPGPNDLGINGNWAKDLNHWLNTGFGYIDRFRKDDEGAMQDLRHNLSDKFDGIRHDVASRWDSTWDAAKQRANSGARDVENTVDGWRHSVANKFDTARHDMASAWDTAWNNTIGRARSGVAGVVNWVNNLPGDVVHIFRGAGSLLVNSGKNIINGLGSGIKSAWGAVANFFKGIPHAILNFLGIHSPPAWAIDAGKHIMNGLHIGMKAGGGTLGNFKGSNVFGQLSGGIMGGVGGGVKQWAPLIVKVLGMLGEPLGDLGAVEHRMMQESGGNPRAINLWDSNAQHGDPSRGLMQTIGGTFDAYAGPFRSLGIYNPLANIYAGLNYAKHAYPGRSLASVMMQPGGYAAGGPAQGWIMAGEHGRELIRVPPSSHVYPHGQTEQMVKSGGSGGHMTIGLAPGTSDSKLMKEIIKQLRVTVFDAGGNVQDVLGWHS